MSTSLVIGASSLIAQALIKNILGENERHVVAVTRNADKLLTGLPALEVHQSDYGEASIADIVSEIAEREDKVDQVFICNGLLHEESLQPEKRLEDLDPAHLQRVMHANAITPLLWIKHLKKILKGKAPCVITVFSARVGSIEDNALGGWYAYRGSKAALNMMVKNASIEYARFAKATRFLVFHPGTADTPLSKPFQKSVPEGKLFKPEFVADQLQEIVSGLERSPGIDYLDWNNQPIPW